MSKIREIIKELERAEEAKQLLERLWYAFGWNAYEARMKVTELAQDDGQLAREIERFFGWDDSE